MNRPPAIYAHRGGAAEAPENTLSAIAHARRVGADGIELDVRETADGRFFVFHDADLLRLAGRSDRLDELSSEEVARVELAFAAGRMGIPTLAAALAAAGPLAVLLDLKSEPGAGRPTGEGLARALASRREPSRLAMSSFDGEAVAAFARARPEIPAGLILGEPPSDDAWLAYPHVSVERRIAADLAAAAEAYGVALFVWTVDDPTELGRWPAATLVSDRPARLVAARAAQAARSTGL